MLRKLRSWRVLHKQRTLKYVASVNPDDYETSVGARTNIQHLDKQLSSRIAEFDTLRPICIPTKAGSWFKS